MQRQEKRNDLHKETLLIAMKQTKIKILTHSLYAQVESQHPISRSFAKLACRLIKSRKIIKMLSNVCESVSLSPVGQHLYICSPLIFGGGTTNIHSFSNTHSVSHVIKGILISCCGLQSFLPTLAGSIDVMFIPL